MNPASKGINVSPTVITFTSTLGTKYPARFSRLLMNGKKLLVKKFFESYAWREDKVIGGETFEEIGGSGDNSGALRQTTEQGIPFTS